jgi:hypothetical protein
MGYTEAGSKLATKNRLRLRNVAELKKDDGGTERVNESGEPPPLLRESEQRASQQAATA